MHPDHGSVERVVVKTQYSSVFCKPFIPWTKPNSDSGPCPECRLPAHPMVSLLPNTTIQVVVLVVQDKQTPQAKRYQVCTEAKTTKPIQDVCTGGPQRPGNETERKRKGIKMCCPPSPKCKCRECFIIVIKPLIQAPVLSGHITRHCRPPTRTCGPARTCSSPGRASIGPARGGRGCRGPRLRSQAASSAWP